MGEEGLVLLEMFDPVDLLDRGMDLREGEEEDGEVDLQQAVSEEERADTVDLLVKVEDPTVDSVLQEVELLTVEEEEDLPLGTKPTDDSQTQVLLSTFQTSVPPLFDDHSSSPHLYLSSTLDSFDSFLPFALPSLAFFDLSLRHLLGTIKPTETLPIQKLRIHASILSLNGRFLRDDHLYPGHLHWFSFPFSPSHNRLVSLTLKIKSRLSSFANGLMPSENTAFHLPLLLDALPSLLLP